MTTAPLIWPGGDGVTMKRRFQDPPPVLFHAFTDAEALQQWWRPRGFRTVALDFQAIEGRRYRVTLHADDGTRWVHEGVFLVVAPPTRLAYTWQWTEGPMARGDTLVDLSFEADGDGTLVTVSHSKFQSGEESGAHGAGWSEAFDRLAARLAARTTSHP